MTLVVDIAGVPTWLADIMATAFPSRSIEGSFRLTTQTGTVHRFALTALALLGVQAPAVSTLADLAARFGMDPEAIAASAHQSLEDTMPDPVRVAASVNLDTVRQSFYGEPGEELRPKVGGSWSWVREVYNDFIVVDDDEGHLFQVPWSEDPANAGAVLWGDPAPVRVEYVAVSGVSAAAKAPDGLRRGALRARLAAMAELPDAPDSASRPVVESPTSDPEPEPLPIPTGPPVVDDPTPPTPPVDPEPPAAEPEPTTEPKEEDPVSDLSEFRSRLGLPDDADEATILAAFDARLQPTEPTPDPTPEPAPTPTPAPQPEPVAASNPFADELKRVSEELAQIKARESAGVKASVLDGAVKAGKIRPADKGNWSTRYDKAPEVITDVLASIAAGTAVPVAPVGEVGDPDQGSADISDERLNAMFSTPFPAKAV